MKTIISILLFTLAWNAHADQIDKTIKVQANGEVHIEITDGRIKMEGWNKSEIRVVGNISRKPDDFVFETHGKNTRIELSGDSHSWWGNNSASADLKIYIPRANSIIADGVSVDFSFDDFSRSVRANTISGNLELSNGSGKIDLSTVSGDITVNDAQGKLDLASVSGDIEVDGNAKYFDANSVSGSISARIGMAERIELETVSGDIEIELGLTEDARLEADTVSGDIDLQFANPKINTTFEIETGPGGRVKNRLSDDKMSKNMTFSGSLEFSLGSGESSVDLETMSGTITLENQ
jgi:DUF4097 and DUF4098 domain-containing protein YvlB